MADRDVDIGFPKVVDLKQVLLALEVLIDEEVNDKATGPHD
jgi:hypothetical protein